MKKQFTILSILTVATSISFAQTIPSYSKSKQAPVKISVNDPKNVINSTTPKAGGDPIWSSDFSVAGQWTTGNVGAGVQGAFTVGAYPAQMTQYIAAMTNGTAPLAAFNGSQYLLSGPIGVQNAYIQSPVIDMSASEIITVSFNQRYRRFNHDATFVEVSTDNGASWDSYQVNTSATRNGPTIQNTEVIDIPIGPNVTQGMIRFRWQSLEADDQFGSGYGWAIDNVSIKEGYVNNVQLFQKFITVGEQRLSYTKMPAAQAAAAGVATFGAIAKNTGLASQNVTLTVTNGAYNQASSAVTIASFGRDTLAIEEANGFTIPTTVGVANFNYALTSNNTLDFTADDAGPVKFEVTNKVMAADAYDGTTASYGGSFNGWQNGGTGRPEIGTTFEIFANDNLHAVQIGIGAVSTQADYIGRSIFATIYELGGSGDPIIIDATEEHFMVSGEFGKLLKLYFMSPVALEAGKTYLVTAGFNLGEPVPVAFSGFAIDGNVLGKDGDNFIGLAPDDVLLNVVPCPVVRLDFTDYTGVEELAAQYNVNAYPNPFNASTEVAFELKNEAAVSIVVTDIAGRKVLDLGSNNYAAGTHTVEINGADLNAGVYNYTITIGNQVITKRIVKK
jgi:hypothetical protein